MGEIFVSHASEDVERVRPLVEALKKQFDVWWDQDLRTGSTFSAEIAERLRKARCVLVCWSKAAVPAERQWIHSEADKARKRDVLFPILLDQVELSSPFDQLQTINLVGWNGNVAAPAFKRLVEDIQAKLKPRRRALLVGVTNAAGDLGLTRLPAVRRSVDALEWALRQPSCGFEVTTLHDPVSTQLMEKLEALFADAQSGDFVLFYYAGHVLLSSGKSLHLAAYNTARDRLKSTSVAVSWLDEVMRFDGQALFVLDACFNGAELREYETALQTTVGQFVLAAPAGPGAEAWHGTHGPLTTHLLRAVTTPEADKDDDHVVQVHEVIEYIDEKLSSGPGQYKALHWMVDPALMHTAIAGSDGRGSSLDLTDEQRAFVDLLAPELQRGRIVPFLGDAIYGTGPLSFRGLADALARRAAIRGPNEGLATIAESLQIIRNQRDEFLEEVREILDRQTASCAKSTQPAHDLVLSLKAPWSVISANYDDLLERRLALQHQRFVLVAHILRSESGEDDGKILVLRSDERGNHTTEVCLAEKLLLEDNDCVIYKVLGAPFLHSLPIAQERNLDTVVITETDHIDFLANLRRSPTAVPNALVRRFRQRLLFLAFSLNIWHYRLISHVFQRRRLDGKRDPAASVLLNKDPFVVRSAATALEDVFWDRLNPLKPIVSIDLHSLIDALRDREEDQ